MGLRVRVSVSVRVTKVMVGVRVGVIVTGIVNKGGKLGIGLGLGNF